MAFPTPLPLLLTTALVLAVPFTLLSSLVVLVLYQRALTRRMGQGPSPAADGGDRAIPAGPPVPGLPASGPPVSGSPVSGPGAPSAVGAAGSWAVLVDPASLRGRERRLWGSLALLSLLVGISFAALYLWVQGLLVPGPSGALRLLVVGGAAAAPGLLMQILLLRMRWWRGVALALLGFAVLLLVAALASRPGPAAAVPGLLAWLGPLLLVPLVLLALLFGIPRLRAVAPLLYLPVLAVCGLALVGQTVLVGLLHPAQATTAASIGAVVELLGARAVLLLAHLLPALAHRLTVAAGRAYRLRQFSDLSYLYGASWLLILLVQVIPLWSAAAGRSLAPLLPLLAWLWIPLFFALVAPRWLSVPRQPGPVLLVLRVFRRPGPVGWLFDHVVQRWRFLAPVLLISAADLAARTVEPQELVEFLEGRLADRYIAGDADLTRQLAAIEDRPDHDGRFRVAEFCCYDTTWKQVLDALLLRSDRVLMDLRGFGAAHGGCLHELGRIGAAGHLSAVVLLADGRTDHEAALGALAAGAALGPGDLPPIHWFEARGRRRLGANAVLRLLLPPVSGGRPA